MSVLHNNNNLVHLMYNSPDQSKKRKKIQNDETLHRNRERNRMHAKKTREKKKSQAISLQMRINELQEEGMKLRQMVDERYTASSLLGLSGIVNVDSFHNSKLLLPSSAICGNYYSKTISENSWLLGDENLCFSNIENHDEVTNQPLNPSNKRVRMRGKYTPQERERIRRERNRIHAKKTRDRKKYFLEIGDKVISEMVKECYALRNYLLSLNILTKVEVMQSERRDQESKKELAILRMKEEQEQEQDEEEEEIASNNSHEGQKEDRSVSGGSSDDNDKTSWNGSDATSTSLSNSIGQTNSSHDKNELLTRANVHEHQQVEFHRGDHHQYGVNKDTNSTDTTSQSESMSSSSTRIGSRLINEIHGTTAGHMDSPNTDTDRIRHHETAVNWNRTSMQTKTGDVRIEYSEDMMIRQQLQPRESYNLGMINFSNGSESKMES